MPDEPDPPRKYYELKPKEFERVNPERPPEEPAPAPSPKARPVDPNAPIDVREIFKQAQMGGGPTLAPRAKPEAGKNDVYDILRQNHDRATAAGLNEVSQRPKRASRRKRDYWLLMGIGTAVMGTGVVINGLDLLGGNKGALVPVFYCTAGLLSYNLILWWVMWHVMEDY